MDATDSATDHFCVGDWLVQPKLAKIRRGDEAVHLTPRAMAVLVFLAQAKGAVVTRNEILDAVWPRMAVTNDALTQCIVELRKAFRDNSKNPSVIETIPKVGVRLIARIAPATAPAVAMEAVRPHTSNPETAIDGPPVSRRISTRRLSPLTAVLIALVIGIAMGALWLAAKVSSEQRPDAATGSNGRSIAVLPFSYVAAAFGGVEAGDR